MTPRASFRSVANAEAVTWTLLIAGLIARAADLGGWGVTVGGALHGFVFLAYVVSVVVVGLNQRWRLPVMALGIASAFLPYATIPFDRIAERRGFLEGKWRLEATDHPADHRWPDTWLRWALHRPTFAISLGLAAIAATFVVLLLLGPPGGRD